MKTQFVFRRIVFVMLVLVLLCAAAAACADGVPAAGSLVTFGHYEQDRNTENGPEEIQWIVLDTDGDRVFLLSKYGLDAKQYNVKYTRVTWETCSLRQWLNSTFLDSAFTAEEQEEIFLTDVDNSPEQTYEKWRNVKNGNNTQDKIFLLSFAEANKYLGVAQGKSPVKARMAPTAFAVSRKVSAYDSHLTEDGKKAAMWTLRSPGEYDTQLANVFMSGGLSISSLTYWDSFTAVRPAMWVDLTAWP